VGARWVDITVPNAARVYDYALGGYHHFAVEQAERLREYGCDLGQGYHLGRPLRPEQADALFRSA
jgi:hypothetical protein